MTGALYSFLVRDPRSFAVIAEVPMAAISRVEWGRSRFEPSRWSMVLSRSTIEAANSTLGVDLIARQNLVEIRRDGVVEFQGYILNRALDTTTTIWTVSGYDLLDWLRRRIVGRTTAVTKSGIAETVLKAFVEENLGTSAGTRAATAELNTPNVFSIETDQARGSAVAYTGQRALLDRVTAEVCRQGALVQRITLTSTGPHYSVDSPVDATVSTGGTVFSVNLDNVTGIGYTESFENLQNALTVAGSGTGNSRTTREVTDTTSIDADFRREGVLTAPTNSINAELDAIGAAEIIRQETQAISAEVIPLSTSGNAEYRADWDVGWMITVAIPAAGIVSIDRQIAAMRGVYDNTKGEFITFTLGTEAPRSQMTRLSRVLSRMQMNLSA